MTLLSHRLALRLERVDLCSERVLPRPQALDQHLGTTELLPKDLVVGEPPIEIAMHGSDCILRGGGERPARHAMPYGAEPEQIRG